jgi:SAM-dependent methyltransferase
MSNFLHKFNISLERHGTIGMLGVVTKHIIQIASSLRPSVRRLARERADRCSQFDLQFGVDTAGVIHHTDLKVDSQNRMHAACYVCSDPQYVRDVLGSLSIDYRRFVFIDFGSGKGRVILLATEFPFKRIIGVEFAAELHKIAEKNIARFRSEIAMCKDIESICIDATTFTLPEDCLVCYFFNPFDATIMSKVVSNIKKSLIENSREIFIVYANPTQAAFFDQDDCFQRVETRGPVTIWKTTINTLEKNLH